MQQTQPKCAANTAYKKKKERKATQRERERKKKKEAKFRYITRSIYQPNFYFNDLMFYISVFPFPSKSSKSRTQELESLNQTQDFSPKNFSALIHDLHSLCSHLNIQNGRESESLKTTNIKLYL